MVEDLTSKEFSLFHCINITVPASISQRYEVSFSHLHCGFVQPLCMYEGVIKPGAILVHSSADICLDIVNIVP